jgi:hypothetical protein
MRNIDLKIPERWEELSPEQVKYTGRLYNMKIDRCKMLVFAFLRFSGVQVCRVFKHDGKEPGRHHFRYRGKKFSLYIDEFAAFCERLSFITEPGTGIMPPPAIKSFMAPDDRIFNLSLEEYLTADFQYISSNEYTRHENTVKIVSALWRKKDERFEDKLIERRYRKFKNTDPDTITAVYVWWTGVKNYLRQEYPFIFSPAGENAEVSPRDMVLGLLSAFNDGKPQDNDKILKTNVHEIFWELNKKIENQQKRK